MGGADVVAACKLVGGLRDAHRLLQRRVARRAPQRRVEIVDLKIEGCGVALGGRVLGLEAEPFEERAQTRLHASTTLTELLEALKPYAPVRCIVVLPGAGAILESAVDASRWTMSESTTPTGKTLLTCKIADGGGDGPPPFELHLDVDRAKKATLGVSPKTGGPIVRVMDGDGAGLVTLLPTGDSFVDDVVGKLGEEVDLVRR